ncbi:MAG: RNA methyltransferase [Castellaniella sp.]
MVAPSHPGNVGAAARAIKTMGFRNLCVVAPQRPDMTRDAQAEAMASGAQDVLHDAQEFATLEQALAPVSFALALTARARDLGPPPMDIREGALSCGAHLEEHALNQVGIVLGPERAGLENAHVALCQRVCHIPANPEYSSLNVAQATQLIAWELRYTLAQRAGLLTLPDTRAAPDPGRRVATQEDVHAFLTHLEQALVATEFLNPAQPGRIMLRMHHIFERSQLSHDEVKMLRGVCSAMMRAAGRHAK